MSAIADDDAGDSPLQGLARAAGVPIERPAPVTRTGHPLYDRLLEAASPDDDEERADGAPDVAAHAARLGDPEAWDADPLSCLGAPMPPCPRPICLARRAARCAQLGARADPERASSLADTRRGGWRRGAGLQSSFRLDRHGSIAAAVLASPHVTIPEAGQSDAAAPAQPDRQLVGVIFADGVVAQAALRPHEQPTPQAEDADSAGSQVGDRNPGFDRGS